MSITMDEIKSLARLSKLSFSDEELSSFSEEFSQILSFADEINASVEGDTLSIREVQTRKEMLSDLRGDEVKDSLESEKITSNAVSEKGCFSVRRVVK